VCVCVVCLFCFVSCCKRDIRRSQLGM